MRPLPFILLFVCACGPKLILEPPPADAFYYPSSMLYVDDPATPDSGILYVANGNFDRRYDNGSVMAVRLSNIGSPDAGLPDFGTHPSSWAGPFVYRHELNLGPNAAAIIPSFAGEIGTRFELDGSMKLVIPTRAELSAVPVVIVGPTPSGGFALDSLSCAFPGSDPADCVTNVPSLVENEYSSNSNLTGYRAPGAFGVGLPLSTDPNPGDTFVVATDPVDSPYGSNENFTNYVVRFNVDGLAVSSGGKAHLNDPADFINIADNGSNSVVVGSRFAYITGRFISPQATLLRLVDRTGGVLPEFPLVESNYRALEARGLAMTSDETRLFMVTRVPDSLLVLAIQNPTSAAPTLNVINSVPLPPGPNFVKLIERPGRGALAVIASTNIIPNVTGSQNNLGTVVVYDDDVGQLVAETKELGIQPFGLAIQRIGGGARIFASLFGEGRVAVLDMVDVTQPQNVSLVAYLGKPHACTIDPTQTDFTCTEELPR